MKLNKMTKLVGIFTLAILAIVSLAIYANAEDKILDTTVDSMTVAMTKNDNEYVRIIITEPRTLNGVAYNRSLPVMAFGDKVEQAKGYSAGDPLKAVASYRKLPDGRESYTILQFIE